MKAEEVYAKLKKMIGLVSVGIRSTSSTKNPDGSTTITINFTSGSPISFTMSPVKGDKGDKGVGIKDALIKEIQNGENKEYHLILIDDKNNNIDAGKIPVSSGGIEVGDSADDISYQNSNYPSWTNVKKALDGIMAKVDYIKPEITSFTSNAQAVYEVGQKVSSVTFNWTLNKNVTNQTLTDCTINANSRTATYTNMISSNKTFTLTVGDGQNTASKSISIAFRNKIYYGSSVIPSNFNSAFILGLSKKQFATSKSGSFSITVGSNEYGFIAFPSSFGTLTSVKIGGFDTDVTSCGNISFTNSSGGVATYSIYRTGRHSLGAITMVIS